MKFSKLITKFNLDLLKSISLIICLLLLSSCTVFDSEDTATLVAYPTPTITDLQVKESVVTLTISISLNTKVNSDFTNYLVLLNTTTTTISLPDNMSELTSVSQIPSFVSSTAKPNFSGGGVDDLVHSFTYDSFSNGSDYQVAVLAYGYNEVYGGFKDNNGWLYSSLSSAATFHKSRSTNSTSASTSGKISGYSVSSDNLVFTTASDISFTVQSVNNGFALYITPTGGTLRSIDYYSDFSSIITIPDSGYSTTALPITVGSTFTYKKSDNTYHKINIISFTPPTALSSTPEVEIAVIYSTVADKRNF